ncbi:disulfide bond formation protein B [Haloarcula brevis]|uniref:disulfide bond formation protein B n=1 Tax=Haloarcula brevis TaxID=3111453 RepID=UPI00300EB54F
MAEPRRPADRARLLLAAATVVATVATAGSLYLSLGLGLTPCRLCWYQRILMYPLVVVLGVAAVEDRPGVVRTALPLAVPGAAVAGYHSWLQVSQTTCGLGAVSCAQIQYRVLGLTVPNLALTAFVLVTGLVVAAARLRRGPS